MSAEAQRAREAKAGAGLIGTAFLWGTMIAFTGTLLHTYDPFVIAAARYVLAVPTLVFLVWWLERDRRPTGPLPVMKVLALGGIGMTGFATCYTYGILWSDPITAAAIIALNPVVSVAMNWVLERVATPWKLLPGTLLATAGAVIVGLGKPSAGGPGLAGGEILLLVGAVIWIWYSVKAQTWLAGSGLSQLRLSALTTGVGAAGLVVVLFASAALGHTHLPDSWPTPFATAQFLWIGVLSTAAAIAIWNAGVSVLGVGVASLFGNLAPVFAVSISVALGTEPNMAQLAGGAVVIAGVLWVQLLKLKGAA